MNTMPKICIEFEQKKKESKNMVMNTKLNTHYTALAIQLERQVEKKVYTYDTDS